MVGIFKKNSVKVFLLLIFLLLLLWIVSRVETVFVLLLLSILMSYILLPFVAFLESKGIKRLYGY